MNATVHKTFASHARYHRDGTTSRAVMELNPTGETLHLRGAQLLRIESAAGWTIRALSGSVWITQDGDVRDVVLDAGQSFIPDRDGDVVVSPFGEARVCLARSHGCTTTESASSPVVSLAAFA